MARTIFVDPWDLSEEAAQSRYEKVVRKLNDRMREMERHGVTTEAVEKYQNLVDDMTDGRKRLPSKVSADEARNALLRVQDILEMRGSSWKETKEFSLKGMKSFREKYGINFKSVKQYNDFWASENVQRLKQLYGSAAAMEAANMRTSDDAELQKAAEDFLEDDELGDDEILEALGFENQTDLLRKLAERLR